MVEVEPEPLEIKNLIREMRSRLDLTQEQFAARLGVTFPTVNRWENGHFQPSPMAKKLIYGLLLEMGEQGADLRSAYFPNVRSS
jgi:DNA-binding transcriptional regulator YiaG